MSASVDRKIEQFRGDTAAQARFRTALRAATLHQVVDPTVRPQEFGREFVVQLGGRRVAFPLLRHEDRIVFLEEKLAQMARGEAEPPVHPASAYLELAVYQEQFRTQHEAAARRRRQSRPTAAKTGRAAGRKKARKAGTKGSKSAQVTRVSSAEKWEQEGEAIFLRLEKLKKKLKVPPTFARAAGLPELRNLVLAELEALLPNLAKKETELGALRAELEMYRRPGFSPVDMRRKLDELTVDNRKHKTSLHVEKRRSESLEQEVQRLAEQILATPGNGPATTEELEILRRDFNVLSEKYDTLVSKNIELVNRLERAEQPSSLETILDTLREKINAVLRAGVQTADDVLLRRIQEELIQLVRARNYLGRALYDLGLLYLRLGRRKDALRELRAARELGIEEPETNRLLNA